MTTKNFQFFITLDQLETILADIAEKQKLWLIFYRRENSPRLQLAKGADEWSLENTRNYDMIFISREKPEKNQLLTDNLNPAKYGWLQLELPKEDGGILYLADLAVKTDWYSSTENNVYNNENLVRFYNKVKKELKSHLSSPIYAVNIVTGKGQRIKIWGTLAQPRTGRKTVDAFSNSV